MINTKMAILGMIATSVCHANLVTNGGFEQPDIDSGSLKIFTSIEGWLTTYGFSLEIRDNYRWYGLPYEGDQFLELDGAESSNIIQNIPTQAGRNYQLSFAYAARSEDLAGLNEIDVYWDGAIVVELRKQANELAWGLKAYTVTATSDSTILEFRDMGESTSFGAYLDDVVVVPHDVCGDELHPYPPGDLTKDCKVNFDDVVIIAMNWLACTFGCDGPN